MLTKLSSLKTSFSGVDFSKYLSKVSEFVNEFSSRANKEGKFLNWVNLPSEQLKRLDDIYDLVSSLKSNTGITRLSILGIGGSKHTVEHMLGINGLNINGESILFYSDVDSTSFNRFLSKLGGDVLSSNYLIASKSGSTFETKDGFLRIQKMLEDAYIAMLLNNTVKTQTEASIINSTVSADDIEVLATNLSESEVEVSMESKAGQTSQGGGNTGNSSISITDTSG